MLASDGPHKVPITIPETWMKKRLLYLKILLYSTIFRISWKANKSIYLELERKGVTDSQVIITNFETSMLVYKDSKSEE